MGNLPQRSEPNYREVYATCSYSTAMQKDCTCAQRCLFCHILLELILCTTKRSRVQDPRPINLARAQLQLQRPGRPARRAAPAQATGHPCLSIRQGGQPGGTQERRACRPLPGWHRSFSPAPRRIPPPYLARSERLRPSTKSTTRKRQQRLPPTPVTAQETDHVTSSLREKPHWLLLRASTNHGAASSTPLIVSASYWWHLTELCQSFVLFRADLTPFSTNQRKVQKRIFCRLLLLIFLIAFCLPGISYLSALHRRDVNCRFSRERE